MLQSFLEQNKQSILQEWFDLTINTYGPEMVRFLKKEKNQFSNPVRNTIVTSLEKIYDCILNDNGIDEYDGLLEIIKIRAVQDFSPSEALSFVFDLKKIIRTKLSNIGRNAEKMVEINEIDEKFDTLIRRAFDLYNECRLKIQEIKIAEIKSRSERAYKILQKKINH